MKRTFYDFSQQFGLTIAVVADLHGKPYARIVEELQLCRPDFIAIPGDISGDYVKKHGQYIPPNVKYIGNFLHACSEIAPTFFSLGNHDIWMDEEKRERIGKQGAVLLDNGAVRVDERIVVGGLSSASVYGKYKHLSTQPDTDFLDEFERQEGYKILLCHHPEYYDKYLRDRQIDLILSGHAHGGQIRLFGHGLIAPGQGFFPKYTSGIIDGKMVISRGLANTARPVPRLFNEKELVFIKI